MLWAGVLPLRSWAYDDDGTDSAGAGRGSGSDDNGPATMDGNCGEPDTDSVPEQAD